MFLTEIKKKLKFCCLIALSNSHSFSHWVQTNSPKCGETRIKLKPMGSFLAEILISTCYKKWFQFLIYHNIADSQKNKTPKI